jgi:hypothetical protein
VGATSPPAKDPLRVHGKNVFYDLAVTANVGFQDNPLDTGRAKRREPYVSARVTKTNSSSEATTTNVLVSNTEN